ncbi:hypothetical protein JCM3774_001823 [Rhodotorula dairenensis]
MSLSDLDYVNAAVSESERPPARNGSAQEERTALTTSAGEELAPERARGGNGAGAMARTADESSSPPAAGVPTSTSLAALLANLQSVTLEAENLGVTAAGTALDPEPSPIRNGHSERDDDHEDEEGDEIDLDSLKDLLAKLDETEGAADDLEGRLDGLIDNLDKLLGVFGGATPSSTTVPRIEAEPDDLSPTRRRDA